MVGFPLPFVVSLQHSYLLCKNAGPKPFCWAKMQKCWAKTILLSQTLPLSCMFWLFFIQFLSQQWECIPGIALTLLSLLCKRVLNRGFVCKSVNKKLFCQWNCWIWWIFFLSFFLKSELIVQSVNSLFSDEVLSDTPCVHFVINDWNPNGPEMCFHRPFVCVLIIIS